MRIKFYMLVSFLCVFICGCNDDEASRPYPRVTTDGVISISDEGALFQGFITSYDENKISLVGFVWSDNSDPRLDKSEVVFLSPEVINENRFTFSLRSTLDAGKSYWVRAFAIQDEFRVYGDTTSFISQGSSSNPVIEEFEPKSGTDSSEITISGEGFSHKNEENKVSFGNLEARVISSSVEELKVLVPAGISTRESTLTVEVTGNAFIAETKFQRLAP
ncbi:MAG: IPT/TIG domain-containing protein, partial [Ekhidna sp.]